MAGNYFQHRRHTPIQQYIAFKQRYPEWVLLKRRNGFVAKGFIKPTPLSENYQVEIRYTGGDPLKIFVLSPVLLPIAGESKIKHTYPDGSLCLYYPLWREWTTAILISDSIVDWTALWLYHYEVWHAIGEWLGSGIEH